MTRVTSHRSATPAHITGHWTLNRKVTRTINGFNSTCLHVITGDDYRVTATAPACDLVLAVRKRRLRYLGHVLRLPADRMVRRADLGRFRIRSRNQRTNLNPNPDLIPDSDSCVVESDLESESCRFESESDSDS